MTHQQAGAGVRVRVTGNSVNAKRVGDNDAYLQVGDEITLTGEVHMTGGQIVHYYDRGHFFQKHYVRINEIELAGPRVKNPPKVDIWEAARGYIR